tara:strand:+ start:74 stop:253 length:180 start_codon:yes stop_codon:yes gene_type:complete
MRQRISLLSSKKEHSNSNRIPKALAIEQATYSNNLRTMGMTMMTHTSQKPCVAYLCPLR